MRFTATQGLLDKYLAPVDMNRLRLKRTLMASASSLFILALLVMMYQSGMLNWRGLWVSVGAVSSVLAFIHLLLATGWNLRLSDPSMTSLQIVLASAAMLVVASQASTEGHAIALMTLSVAFVYASFRFGFRSLLRLGSILMIMALVEVLLRVYLGRDTTLGYGLVELMALAIMLFTLAMVGGQFNDMRRRIQAERAISHVAMTQLSEAVVTVDKDSVVKFMNEGARALFGFGEEADAGMPIDRLCEFSDQRPLSETLQDLMLRLDGQRRHDGNWSGVGSEMTGGTIQRADGEFRFVRMSVSPLMRHGGLVDGFVLVVRDISETRRMMNELEHAATHDVLTGLLNRRGFIEVLQNAMDTSLANDEVSESLDLGVSVIAIDLDQFKMVNDSCGHDAGDDLLRSVAAMMRNTIPLGASLARLGGDEFGIVLPPTPLSRVELLGHRLVHEFSELHFVRQERSFRVGASIGIAQESTDCRDAASLLSRADSASYLAKQRGRNCVQIYTMGDVEVSRHHQDMGWAARINDSLEQQRFILYAQRIVPAVLGLDDGDYFEVLVRMVDGDGSIIEPNVFLPAAERFNLITAIDREVIRLAMLALSEFKASGKPMPRLSVNLSPSSLRDRHLLSYISRQLATFDVPGKCLTFELTETAAIFDLDQAQTFFRELKRFGCRVALDDVGSGFNSFYNLRQLPVDQIKIDGSYVRSARHNPLDLAFVESIQRIADILNVETVAEFVENDGIRVAMTGAGVQFLQGFGVHPPEPLAGIGERLGMPWQWPVGDLTHERERPGAGRVPTLVSIKNK